MQNGAAETAGGVERTPRFTWTARLPPAAGAR
jgi:hypothetical protein